MADSYERFVAEVLRMNDEYKAAERYYERMMWHKDNLQRMLSGDFLSITPVTVDFILTNECNYRCEGCTFGFVRETENASAGRRNMKTEHIPLILGKLRDAGVKAVIFSGGGEPTLHKDLAYGMGLTKQLGMDVALYSNGSFLHEDLADRIIASAPSYVRISLNAGADVYKAYHKIEADFYPRVIRNIRALSRAIQATGARTALGVSYLINNTNVGHFDGIAASIDEILGDGKTRIDYVTIKPEVNYRDPHRQLNPAAINAIGTFFRDRKDEISAKHGIKLFCNTFFLEKLLEGSHLNSPCTSHGWVANVDWNGDMAFCVEYAMNPTFIIGNLVRQSFNEVWFGARRIQIHRAINKNIEKCPQVCRNRVKNHLTEILQPPYDQVRTGELMDNIASFQRERAPPPHNNFL